MAVEYKDFQEPQRVNVEGRGNMRFHNWISEDQMCFVGSNDQATYTLQISREQVDKQEDGSLKFKRPYEVNFSRGKLELSRLLEDVGVQIK